MLLISQDLKPIWRNWRLSKSSGTNQSTNFGIGEIGVCPKVLALDE